MKIIRETELNEKKIATLFLLLNVSIINIFRRVEKSDKYTKLKGH
jgi:hypothetical protein